MTYNTTPGSLSDLLNAQAHAINNSQPGFGGAPPMRRPQPAQQGFGGFRGAPPAETRGVQLADDSSESEEITLGTLIAEKPKPKVVREFFRDKLEDISGADEVLFGRY